MSNKYQDEYSIDFEKELTKIIRSNPQIKKMVKKAIDFILQEPYVKSKEFLIGGIKCRRKNICAGNFRIIYEIDELGKIVKFFNFWPKKKTTYKSKPSVFIF